MILFYYVIFQYVDFENLYFCGYLKIKGFIEEYLILIIFFDGEIISKKYLFLIRKWEVDEDVDRKYWVFILNLQIIYGYMIKFKVGDY